MKILMVCASPSPQNSTSLYLLNALSQRLGPEHETAVYSIAGLEADVAASQIAEALPGCDALVLAYSLYVDGLPALLIDVLKQLEPLCAAHCGQVPVHQIVNNGFYEATENALAIEMVWNWCSACGFGQGAALGVGGGPMAKAAPLGHGPCATLGKRLHSLAEAVALNKTREIFYSQPDFPRFLYLWAGNQSWNRLAKKNGLRPAQLKGKAL